MDVFFASPKNSDGTNGEKTEESKQGEKSHPIYVACSLKNVFVHVV